MILVPIFFSKSIGTLFRTNWTIGRVLFLVTAIVIYLYYCFVIYFGMMLYG